MDLLFLGGRISVEKRTAERLVEGWRKQVEDEAIAAWLATRSVAETEENAVDWTDEIWADAEARRAFARAVSRLAVQTAAAASVEEPPFERALYLSVQERIYDLLWRSLPDGIVPLALRLDLATRAAVTALTLEAELAKGTRDEQLELELRREQIELMNQASAVFADEFREDRFRKLTDLELRLR